MTYRFVARYIFSERNEDVLMVGFSDDEFEPQKYVLLQRSLNPNERDKQLGMDRVHIQVEDELRSQYGGIQEIVVNGSELLIAIELTAQSFLKVEGGIVISLEEGGQWKKEIKDQLCALIDGQFSFVAR